MTYNSINLHRITKDITAQVEEHLAQAGFFYRIFYRCKSIESLEKKLDSKKENGSNKYDGEDKFLRDILGIRINLYFVDDLKILFEYFKTAFANDFLEETIDEHSTTQFEPTRVNLIFRIPAEFKSEFNEVVHDKRVDTTFELQLRTVFSEGWHEVEHDLRYKCPDDWNDYFNLSRTFNGVLAALETHEWSMLKIFDELSYNHQKSKNISAMLRTKLRIRIIDFKLSSSLNDLISREETFCKEVFKLDRIYLIKFLLEKRVLMPFKMDNIVFFLNHFFIKNESIARIVPLPLLEEFRKIK